MDNAQFILSNKALSTILDFNEAGHGTWSTQWHTIETLKLNHLLFI